MTDKLSKVIIKLIQSETISSSPILISMLGNIDRYGDSDPSKAYLLGYFFKYWYDTDELERHQKLLLLDTLKDENLDSYFYHHEKPEKNSFGFLVYAFIIGGLLAIVAGVFQLYNGNYWYGFGTKYIMPVVREGGYKLIAGLILFIGGMIRIKYEKRKAKFIQTLIQRKNNST